MGFLGWGEGIAYAVLRRDTRALKVPIYVTVAPRCGAQHSRSIPSVALAKGD
jgi:hypothetical protein